MLISAVLCLWSETNNHHVAAVTREMFDKPQTLICSMQLTFTLELYSAPCSQFGGGVTVIMIHVAREDRL